MDPAVPAPPKYLQEKIRSLLTEARDVSMGNLRDTAVVLRFTGSTTVLTGSDSFQVPAGRQFLVREIRGHVALMAPELETFNALPPGGGGIGGTVGGTGGTLSRIVAKALACRLSVVNQDRSELRVVDADFQGVANTLCMADLLECAGGSPIVFGEELPLVIPASETIRMDVTLQEAAVAGQATEYALVLVGSMVATEG